MKNFELFDEEVDFLAVHQGFPRGCERHGKQEAAGLIMATLRTHKRAVETATFSGVEVCCGRGGGGGGGWGS